MREFDLNANVKIKLTSYGIEILEELHEWIEQERKKRGILPSSNDKAVPDADEDGYVTMPMHMVMRIFGPYLREGMVTPFDTRILIDDKDLVDKGPRKS